MVFNTLDLGYTINETKHDIGTEKHFISIQDVELTSLIRFTCVLYKLFRC